MTGNVFSSGVHTLTTLPEASVIPENSVVEIFMFCPLFAPVHTLRIQKNAQLFLRCFSSGSATTKITCLHEGTDSQSEISLISYHAPGDNTNFLCETSLNCSRTHSNIHTLSLENGGVSNIEGSISVAPHTIGTEANVRERIVFLGTTPTKSRSIPGLSVSSQESKASHACLAERIPEEHLTFCLSRGLDAHASAALILNARIHEALFGVGPNHFFLRKVVEFVGGKL